MSEKPVIRWDEPPSPWHTPTDEEIARFSNRRTYRGFEGGSVDLAECGGKFWVIKDEGTMADFMDEEDQGQSFVKVREFDTDAERAAFLTKAYPERTSRDWSRRSALRNPGPPTQEEDDADQ